MDDQGRVPIIVGGGLGIRGIAWTFSLSDSAMTAYAGILAEGLLVPSDEAILSVGKRTDDENGWILVLLFASPISRTVLERIHHIAVDHHGAAVVDLKIVPTKLLGQAFLRLLRKTVESFFQSGQTGFPYLLFGTLARSTVVVEESAPSCAECGALMIKEARLYKCLNCGATREP